MYKAIWLKWGLFSAILVIYGSGDRPAEQTKPDLWFYQQIDRVMRLDLAKLLEKTRLVCVHIGIYVVDPINNGHTVSCGVFLIRDIL